MFEAAELGRKVSRKDFDAAESELQAQLLALQSRQRESDFPVIVVVAGVEGAGRGRFVDCLHKWLDARAMATHAYLDETDDERQRPRYWRFWRALPPRARMGIFFGSWYTRPIVSYALGDIEAPAFEHEMRQVNAFEKALVDDGALIIKLWFHLSLKGQLDRLERDSKKHPDRVSPLLRKFSKRYSRFVEVSERAIRLSDAGHAPWNIIESDNARYRDLTAGRLIATMLQQRLEVAAAPSDQPARHGLVATGGSVLERVDLSQRVEEEKYRKHLKEAQEQLYALGWEAYHKGITTVAAFEGWDAAGKGGAIRRVTRGIDSRLYTVIPIAAPTDEEAAHHYMWRFWRHLPRAGYMTIFDRTWYGRVLVERVEQRAQPHEWGRAYREINDFEEQLTQHGVVLMKFWLHIDSEEQLRRFRAREVTPLKQHKITDEDWRNRERWQDYEDAVTEMVARTGTASAPWTLVAANDKLHARLTIIDTFIERLSKAIKNA